MKRTGNISIRKGKEKPVQAADVRKNDFRPDPVSMGAFARFLIERIEKATEEGISIR